MKPEDIDDLFKKKLGGYNPTPSADAWQRLQEQLQPQPKRKVIPMWWSVAASLAFLILLGTYFYYAQPLIPGAGQVAQVTEPQVTEPLSADQLTKQPKRGEETGSSQEEGQAPGKEQNEEPSLLAQAGTESAPVAAAPQPATSTRTVAQTAPVKPKASGETTRQVNPVVALPESGQLAQRDPAPLPTQPGPAAAMEVMEVMILKNESGSALALAETDGQDLGEEPSVKRQVVKGLLNQVKNLASGKKVNLPDLNNYSIAFETQIGNRKISKTINF